MILRLLVIAICLLPPTRLMATTPLEDFEQYTDGAYPNKWRGKNNQAQSIYRVASENGNRFLRAHSRNQGVQIALEQIVDPKELRRLAWRWRVREIYVNWRVSGSELLRVERQRLVQGNSQYLADLTLADVVALLVILTFFAVKIVVVGHRDGIPIDDRHAFDFLRHLLKSIQVEN